AQAQARHRAATMSQSSVIHTARLSAGAPLVRTGRRSEQDVELPDRLVDLPGAGPAAGEDGGVARADLGRLAAVRRHRHPAGQDVHELVVVQAPPGRPGRALPDARLLRALAGPQRGARGMHRLASGLLQRAPVLELGVGRGGQERGSGDDDEAILSGKGRAMGSVARRLRPASSKRPRPSSEVSSTSEEPVSATSAVARARAGPHIMPAPAALATVTRSRARPMMGKWSGVYSMVAAQTRRRPSPAVTGTSAASRARILARYPSSTSRFSPGGSSGLLMPNSRPPSSGRQ